MEANRDSAFHYIELAEKAILANENERAVRYLNKAEDLFPTQKAKDLIKRLMNSNSHSTSNTRTHESASTSPNHDHTTTNGARHRKTSTTASDYTAEEVEAVRKVRICKDLYDILGVNKTASEADLKKAYRKLALQFHPDKCKAPGATDAFKAIGKAFSILSDPKKREEYDQYGQAMEPQHHRGNTGGSGGGRRSQYYYCDEDDDFSAEEIFNLFFGHSGGTTRTYRRRPQQNTFHFTTQSTQNSTNTLAQLLPYLLLFLISIIGTFLVSEPQFQMHRTGKYTNIRKTRSSNIDYYVKSDFRPPKTNAEFDQFDSSVVDEYISDLRQQCYREQQSKESMIWRAKMMDDDGLLNQAHKQATPSCTKLNHFVQHGKV